MIDNPSEKHKQMVEDFQSRKITMEELELETIHWFLDCFPEMHVRPMPTMPPELADYQAMNYKERSKIGQDFWKQTNIKDYLDTKHAIKQENESKLKQLLEFEAIIPEGDIPTREKYRDKINEYREVLETKKDAPQHWTDRYA